MTQPTIAIQSMTPGDIPACVQIMLENDLWRLYNITAEGAELMFRSALSTGAKIIVAKQVKEIVGFAWFVLHGAWDRSAYLRLIGVRPAFQGLSIGECLLKTVEELAACDVGDIFLLVTDSNTSAQRFYLRLGYSQVGAIPNYVVNGITELVFHKQLRK